MSRLEAAASKVPVWAWVLAFSVALCLVGLSRFGFWDPWELKLAEQARDVARSGHLLDPTADGRYQGVRPLNTILAALGIAVFGASELGARIFGALFAVGALLAVYWAGLGLLRRRAALFATLALGTMPLFVLEARQLTSNAPLVAALALALGGLGRYAWPADGRRRLRDFGIGLVGLAVGAFAGGALLGVALPALSLVLALVIGHGLRPSNTGGEDGTAPLAMAGIGRDLPADVPLGTSTLRPGARGFMLFATLGIGALAVLLLATGKLVPGKYSFLLGGVPKSPAAAMTFERLVRELGFGLFPWSAVAVFALARPLIRLDAGSSTEPATNSRLAFVELFFLVFAGLGYAASTAIGLVTGDARFVALAPVALAVGAFLDEALEGVRPEPVAGLLMATGTMIVARDFFLAPEELASLHVREKVRWPSSMTIGNLFLAVGFLTALGVYAGLAARSRALGRIAPRDLTKARPIRRLLERGLIEGGRFGLQIALGAAVLFAFFVAQGLVPRLSTHLSFKPVLESYAKFARPGEKIGKYRVEGKGSSFYGMQALTELPTLDRVVGFLRDPDRVFAMVAADELASLDAAFKQAGVPYYAVDASSSRFLLLTNRLAPGQEDQNPLRKNVWMPPGGEAASAGAKPPWSWRVPVSATFGDAIELVGADFPETVRRPGKIPLELTFRVKARLPSTYRIFVHFDGPAAPRLIGDHDPLGKTFATNHWLPGEYIRDRHETDVPLMTTPAGTYVVYVGFWPGGEGKRLKVTQGPNDGADRVRIGSIEIK